MLRIAIPLAALSAVVQNSSAAEDYDMPPVLRVASIQMEISPNIETNLARILRGIGEAKKAGARLVLFPETALSGFDEATIENLDWDALEQAMEKVVAAARKNEIYCLYGCATKSGKQKPYNSGILVGPDGEEVTRYHKMVPEGWFEPGDHLAYFYVDGIACTIIVCHDNRYPELVRIPAIKGAQICFYISYEVNSLKTSLRKMENYRAQLIARAAENGIWLVQSNGIGSPPGQPDRVVLGYSRIVDPHGGVVTEAPGMADTMLVYDVDPALAKRGNAQTSLSIDLLEDWWQAGVERIDAGAQEISVEIEPSKTNARLALMQGIPEKFDLETNFKTFLEQLDQAAKEDVEIFITPECWLDGYASHAEGCTVEQLRAVAQNLSESEYLKIVSEKAREHKMYICFGFTSLEDGKLHNAAGLWNSEGDLVGVYHKTHLQNKDLKFSPGQSLPVFETDWGPVGIVICADRRWPETIRTMRVKGAKLILLPSYGMHHEANECWMRTRGYENQCYIAFTHPNVGFVVDPKGNIAGKRDAETPGILVCDIDLTKAKDDNHIRDRRPELYQAITHLR